MQTIKLILVLLVGLFGWLALSTSPAHAAGVVGDGTPASCTGDAGDNAFSAVVIGGGLVTFNCGSAPFTLTVSTRVIENAVIIDGGGLITLDGENLRQPFLVLDDGALTLRNITVYRGNSGAGGCLYNSAGGHANLNNVKFIECEVALGNGGAIYNKGNITVTLSLFDNNEANSGGGIYNEGGKVLIRDTSMNLNKANSTIGGAIRSAGGEVTIERSSLVGNQAKTDGGAVHMAAGMLTLINSTISQSQADRGSALFITGNSQTTITNATIYRNHGNLAGGIYNDLSVGGLITIKNTIIAASNQQGTDTPILNCDGPSITSAGFNIISDNSCINTPDGSPLEDQRATDPQLELPGDNGGPTPTRMPKAGSPAINKGSPTGCPATDQRGVARVDRCDIGAVEVVTGGPNVPSEMIFIPWARRS
jgi:hypothetical protein